MLYFGIQLLLFNYEFFFVLLIIVYLGGIAILFLSAVMTLTLIKQKKLNKNFLSNAYINNLYLISIENHG